MLPLRGLYGCNKLRLLSPLVLIFVLFFFNGSTKEALLMCQPCCGTTDYLMNECPLLQAALVDMDCTQPCMVHAAVMARPVKTITLLTY